LQALGDELVVVHHIGSTSVPGLAAKPIIDLLPEARSLVLIDELTPAFERAGYVAKGENGLQGRRYFTRDREGYRTHNVHIYQAGDPDIERHLAFRDYLRSHAQVRDEYGGNARSSPVTPRTSWPTARTRMPGSRASNDWPWSGIASRGPHARGEAATREDREPYPTFRRASGSSRGSPHIGDQARPQHPRRARSLDSTRLFQYHSRYRNKY
jgi:hypothetical protein